MSTIALPVLCTGELKITILQLPLFVSSVEKSLYPERKLGLTNSLHTGYFFILLLSADFFSKLTFWKNSFRNTIRMSNSLDPGSKTVCQGYQLTTLVDKVLKDPLHDFKAD